jgi:hypothetical protein
MLGTAAQVFTNLELTEHIDEFKHKMGGHLGASLEANVFISSVWADQ